MGYDAVEQILRGQYDYYVQQHYKHVDGYNMTGANYRKAQAEAIQSAALACINLAGRFSGPFTRAAPQQKRRMGWIARHISIAAGQMSARVVVMAGRTDTAASPL